MDLFLFEYIRHNISFIDLNTVKELSKEKSAYESVVMSVKNSMSSGSELYSITLETCVSKVLDIDILFDVFKLSNSFLMILI
jgi:hypothetical protein